MFHKFANRTILVLMLLFLMAMPLSVFAQDTEPPSDPLPTQMVTEAVTPTVVVDTSATVPRDATNLEMLLTIGLLVAFCVVVIANVVQGRGVASALSTNIGALLASTTFANQVERSYFWALERLGPGVNIPFEVLSMIKDFTPTKIDNFFHRWGLLVRDDKVNDPAQFKALLDEFGIPMPEWSKIDPNSGALLIKSVPISRSVVDVGNRVYATASMPEWTDDDQHPDVK